MKRLTDPDELRALAKANIPPELVGQSNGPPFLSDPLNIALRIDNDLTLFEHLGEGLYLAHVFCQSRGKQALTNARTMLDEAQRLGARTICGETPIRLRHAIWFARMLGFEPVRTVERPWGKCSFSILSGNTSPDNPVV